jgi:hypothetical protein
MKKISRLFLTFSVLALCLSLTACVVPPYTATTTATSSPETTTPTSTTPPTTTPPSTTTTKPTPTIAPDFDITFKNHFGFMPAYWDYPNARAAGAAYDRPFFEKFQWGLIEKEPGEFDFTEPDQIVNQAQAVGLHILANIQPFAAWDQIAGYGDPNYKGKPYDMEAYANFVSTLVDRYDGDGVNDMPGLTVPIKHWEVMNEPEFQTGPVYYFRGTPADYVDVLKATYEAVKQADPEAYVVQGGMASMFDVSVSFWQGVFDAGGGQYLDIMNIHSIGHGEHLNIPAFKQFLSENGIQDKPIWVTEVQYQQTTQTQNFTNEDFARTLARSYIYALANGVDKLFYVNLRMPPFYDSNIPFDERSALITDDGEESALFQAHLTVATILGEFGSGDTVETIMERIVGWYVDIGQYKFTIHGKTVYALWGVGPLPAEITGEVHIINILGEETVADASSIQLTDSPIFVLLE